MLIAEKPVGTPSDRQFSALLIGAAPFGAPALFYLSIVNTPSILAILRLFMPSILAHLFVTVCVTSPVRRSDFCCGVRGVSMW